MLSPDGHYLFFSSNRTDLEGITAATTGPV
jgi:hypothetical protein